MISLLFVLITACNSLTRRNSVGQGFQFLQLTSPETERLLTKHGVTNAEPYRFSRNADGTRLFIPFKYLHEGSGRIAILTLTNFEVVLSPRFIDLDDRGMPLFVREGSKSIFANGAVLVDTPKIRSDASRTLLLLKPSDSQAGEWRAVLILALFSSP